MPEYKIVRGGREFNVESDTPEQAAKDLNAHLQEQANVTAKTEAETAPEWYKPIMAAHDVARAGADFATFGQIDKLRDYWNQTDDAALRTEAIKQRMGWAAPAAQAATSAFALPSVVPKAIAAVGGGPIVRGVTGLLTGAGEGGTYGALQAAGHDQPVSEGATSGMIGGALGQTIGSTIGGIANRLGKWWTGTSDALPPAAAGAGVRMTKNTAPEKRVETATMRAERDGGRPGDYKEHFKEVKKSGMPGFAPEEKQMVDNIISGDPGTKAARTVARITSGPLGSMAATGGLFGAFTGATPAQTAAAVGLPMIGWGASKAAGQGTRQSVEDLRRVLQQQPKYEGILAAKGRGRIGRAARGGIVNYLEDDQQP